MYSYLPFLLIAVANFMLIYSIKTAYKNTHHAAIALKQQAKQRSTNKTVLVITLVFILMTGIHKYLILIGCSGSVRNLKILDRT